MVGGRGWLLAAALLLLLLQVASPAPHKTHKTEEKDTVAETEKEIEGYLQKSWQWVKHAARKVKGWFVGKHSLYNQVMEKLKENRTIRVLGKEVSFTLPSHPPSSPSSSHEKREGEEGGGVHWGDSISAVMHNLEREPVLRVLLALYVNIVLFIGVYGYLIARHILLSIHLKKAAQPEKERERRREKERKKEAKRLAREGRKRGGGGGGRQVHFSPALSDAQEDTIRSGEFIEEIVMESQFVTPGVGPAAAAAVSAPAADVEDGIENIGYCSPSRS